MKKEFQNKFVTERHANVDAGIFANMGEWHTFAKQNPVYLREARPVHGGFWCVWEWC